MNKIYDKMLLKFSYFKMSLYLFNEIFIQNQMPKQQISFQTNSPMLRTLQYKIHTYFKKNYVGIPSFTNARTKIRSLQYFIEMGAVQAFIEKLDSSSQMEKAAKQAIDISLKMINLRFKNFQDQINIPLGQILKLPAKYLICMKKHVCVEVSKNPKTVADSISKIVQTFASGSIAKGITEILGSALNVILGSFQAGYNQSQDYIVVTNVLGGIYRIDYLVVQQRMQANGIQSRCSDVFGSYLIVTSIDKKDVTDDNIYRVLVDRQFPKKVMKEKMLLVKITKGEQLTPTQMEEIYKITSEDTQGNNIPITKAAEQHLLPGEDKWLERQKFIDASNELKKKEAYIEKYQRQIEEAKNFAETSKRNYDLAMSAKSETEAKVNKHKEEYEARKKKGTNQPEQKVVEKPNTKIEDQKKPNTKIEDQKKPNTKIQDQKKPNTKIEDQKKPNTKIEDEKPKLPNPPKPKL